MDFERVRVRFSKQGDLRLISHRDLMRTLERLFRRAGVVLAMSEGFHPKPRMNFPSALALGIAGLEEVVELDLAQPLAPEALLQALTEHAPPGLTFHRVEVSPDGRKAQAERLSYQADIPPAERERVAVEAERLLAATSYLIRREGRDAPIDLRAGLAELRVADGVLHFKLYATHEAGPRPRDVLEVLGLVQPGEPALPLVRTAVELRG